MPERRWSDDDRELVAMVLLERTRPRFGHETTAGTVEAVLDALTAAGWAPLHQVTCYEVHGEGCHAPENVKLIYAGEHG